MDFNCFFFEEHFAGYRFFTYALFIQQTLQSVSNFTIYTLPFSSNTAQQGKSP